MIIAMIRIAFMSDLHINGLASPDAQRLNYSGGIQNFDGENIIIGTRALSNYKGGIPDTLIWCVSLCTRTLLNCIKKEGYILRPFIAIKF